MHPVGSCCTDISRCMVNKIRVLTMLTIKLRQVGPCHNSMARPQVADEGMTCNMVGSYKYIELAVTDSAVRVVLQLGGLGELLTTPHCKTCDFIKHFAGCLQCLGGESVGKETTWKI